ncbi:ABC transporter permease [Oceanobacillus kapialis]|uniref:ABC transporter permease n=1 Tax=Oceanobacillus kapialis TaxID=481353 RepID=A0ABW5Q271_9BACI
MLLKLSLTSMRKLAKDYLVLLFGLTISIAIFYMFETLAQNKTFLEANSLISSIMFVFHVGTFILAVITVFYIFYATSFLLSLRQKELGMYMTLGAKKRKITQLMFMETFFIGLVALIIGVVLGVGLAYGIAELLMTQLDFHGDGFQALYPSSLLITVLFYVALFFLTSLVNAWRVGRKSVLNLLKSGQQQDKVKTSGFRTFIGVVFSIILIGVGYYVMVNIVDFQQLGIILATVTIIPGTYLIFISLLPYLVKKLKQNRNLNEKGINSFTLGQLRFRMLNLMMVLGTVAMLIALGLGAMTAGTSFYNNIAIQASMFHANDVVVYQPNDAEKKILADMDLTKQQEYRYKVNDEGVYFLKADLESSPPEVMTFEEGAKGYSPTTPDIELSEEQYGLYKEEGVTELPDDWWSAVSTELGSREMFGNREVYVYGESSYQDVQGEEHNVILGKLDDFTDYLPQLEELNTSQMALAESYIDSEVEQIGGKYSNYVALKGLASGTIFMGVFLGIAFLMMMASVLMFKLLSSAGADVHRYNMLRKIGVRKTLLVKSIYRELFLLFLFPAIVGIVHVVVGMQMFSFIIFEPYTKIWIPLTLFIVIYGIYYFITVQMYKRIVLPKKF